MDRFSADSTRRSIFIVELVKSVSLLCSIIITLLQLTTMTTTSNVPLPAHNLQQQQHHHHYRQPPQGLHSPVRWTKLSQNSRQGRPVDVMTDVINDLGVKILDRYLDNTGNVAFSPSGLGFVLVALYEGSAGSSSREISEVLGLPRDRRVTRIGLRDIHRRLRSYLNADAFLGGLTLNRDDINLRPDYEDVLRFYGFDISDSGMENNNFTTQEIFINATDSSISTNSSISTTSSISTISSISTTTPDSSTIIDSIDATNVQSTTTISSSMATNLSNDMVEVITNLIDDKNSAMSVTSSADVSSTIAANLGSQKITETNLTSTNMTNSTSPTITIAMSKKTASNETISSKEFFTTLANVETVSNSEISSSTIIPIQRLVGIAKVEMSDTQTQSSDVTTARASNTTSKTMMNSTVMPIVTILTSPMTILTNPMKIFTKPMSTSESVKNFNYTDETSTTMKIQNSTVDNVEDNATNSVRKRRGILHGHGGYFSSSADDGIWLDEFGRLNNNDDYSSQDDDIVVDPRRPTQIAFLVNGCDYSRVTAAVYTAILPFSHFTTLRASLLEFPLDDPRYKILVVLPSDENGTRRLARILATKPITLRHLRQSLQSTWINAVIPSFMLRGFVTLTPYLQRLGISDVFDPRAADLTPMSTDLGVYARDIQQSIGVNIRNNVKGGIGGADGGNDEQKRQSKQRDDLVRNVRGVYGLPPFFLAGGAISPRSHGNPHYPSYPGAGSPLYERAPPVPFVVDRPFLYFIIDDETSVTLLAGRIDDPLNSRML